jgi:hypothetical protein
VTEFERVTARLVDKLSHWTPPRWAASSVSGGTRAEVVHALVQEIADLAADAEDQPHRPVPRLAIDLSLPDQLRVVATDLLAARPEPAVLARAAELVTQVRRAL